MPHYFITLQRKRDAIGCFISLAQCPDAHFTGHYFTLPDIGFDSRLYFLCFMSLDAILRPSCPPDFYFARAERAALGLIHRSQQPHAAWPRLQFPCNA